MARGLALSVLPHITHNQNAPLQHAGPVSCEAETHRMHTIPCMPRGPAKAHMVPQSYATACSAGQPAVAQQGARQHLLT